MPKADWSSLLTLVYKELQKAEEDLRFIHMKPEYQSEARVHLTTARGFLNELIKWRLSEDK